jgi:hexosaminidase
MRIIASTLSVILSLWACTCLPAQVPVSVPVIPAPQEAHLTDKSFNKKYLDRIQYDRDLTLPAEAYVLEIKKNRIVVRSSDEAGRFYAQQTLAQLSSADVMHCGVIKDAPRYAWRGFMLDEARHFHGKEKVKELLDLMARYKLNRFHWHLSDDQGWRVEIKAFPELTQIGAVGDYTDANAAAKFYTQDDIREIVAYAAERHIEVIPEIDMPGHASAFNRTFPDLAFGSRTVNPENEKLYEVLNQVIKELADIFPGRYLHIGGDEVSGEGWKERQKGFELRHSAAVRAAGKTPIVWDDAIDSDLDPETTIIHWWRADHPESLEKALASGYQTIVSPWDPFYLDYIQDARCKEGHLAWKQYVNGLDEIYNYPLSADEHIIGVQANLWTERVVTSDRLDYMVFPRLIALAEKAWSSSLDYNDFLQRLEGELRYLDFRQVYYFDFRDFSRHPEPLK